MDAIAATELKSNFKQYANQIEDTGEPIIIKRPKNSANLILTTEVEYSKMKRLLEYYEKIMASGMYGEKSVSKRIGIAEGKLKYPDNFDFTDVEIEEMFYSEDYE